MIFSLPFGLMLLFTQHKVHPFVVTIRQAHGGVRQAYRTTTDESKPLLPAFTLRYLRANVLLIDIV